MKNPKLVKGFKFLAFALPIIFAGPIVLMAGISAARDGRYTWLIVGIIICLTAIGLAVTGLRSLLNGFWEMEEEKDKDH